MAEHPQQEPKWQKLNEHGGRLTALETGQATLAARLKAIEQREEAVIAELKEQRLEHRTFQGEITAQLYRLSKRYDETAAVFATATSIGKWLAWLIVSLLAVGVSMAGVMVMLFV